VPEVVQISAEELERIPEVDVSEDIAGTNIQSGMHLERVERPRIREPRSAEKWAPEIQRWRDFVINGGTAWGAFVADRLIAFAVLRVELSKDTAQLAGLYVDRSWRRHGLATALVEAVAETARTGGAVKLYVSAAETDSAVSFYLGHGFRPLETPNPELLELEPKDIHMILPL
jgi:GNAT superfamily N-acetyltransferase